MNRKIILPFLINCLLLQSLLVQTGCMSFYSDTEHPHLSDYRNSENRILIRFNDGLDLLVNAQDLYFIEKPSDLIYGKGEEFHFTDKNVTNFKGIIEKNRIDSSKVVEVNSIVYHIYWTNDKRRFNFKEQELNIITPELGNGFWIALDSKRIIYDRDIYEIQYEKINWITTTSIVLLLAVSIVFVIYATAFSNYKFN